MQRNRWSDSTGIRNHTDIADLLDNLAELYEKQKRYTELLPLYRRTLTIRKNDFLSDSLRVDEGKNLATDDNLKRLEIIYRKLNRSGELVPLYRDLLAKREQVLGPDRDATGNIVERLLEFQIEHGSREEAGKFFMRRQAMLEKKHGLEHHSTMESLRDIATWHEEGSRLPEAIRLYK